MQVRAGPQVERVRQVEADVGPYEYRATLSGSGAYRLQRMTAALVAPEPRIGVAEAAAVER
jgi:hypothetical protein